MNYWYASRPDEIFVDLDSRRSLNRAVHVLRRAMLDRKRQKRLHIQAVYIYPSVSAGHAHLIVVLKQSMHEVCRVAWSAWLGNDRLRLAYVLQRHVVVGPGVADLLVSKQLYFREADDVCRCSGKHKKDAITSKCPAMGRLLGSHRSADYFYRTGSVTPIRKIRVPWGKVSVRQIREWTTVKG